MWAHEQLLTEHMLSRLAEIQSLRVIGSTKATNRIPLFTFFSQKTSSVDLVRALDACGIAIRAGDLAALPILKRYGVRDAARASLYVYTTLEDVDRCCTALRAAAG